MTWIDNISELQFYSQPENFPCYCELLLSPDDIILQAQVPNVSQNAYTVKIEVLTADGATILEDATLYFEWYSFQGTNGKWYVNMRAKRFSPEMCSNKCFILLVTIISTLTSPLYVVFEKYTERYCLDDCCLVPSEIRIQDPDEGGEYDQEEYNNDYNNL